ncbi:MAG: hypothetical protein AB1571_01055 [Nanoarchaeota archaeon]
MTLINPAIGAKLVFVLGITNVIGLLLIYFSCRCRLGNSFFSKLIKKKWYEKFYNMHCYFWWFFFTSVVLHAIIALLTFGIPF